VERQRRGWSRGAVQKSSGVARWLSAQRSIAAAEGVARLARDEEAQEGWEGRSGTGGWSRAGRRA